MKSRSFQILINVVSVLWCPLEWVSKIKTDSSGLTLTLLYYTAAVTSFSATFPRLSPIYDSFFSHCCLSWIPWNWLSYRGLPYWIFAELPKWPQNNFGTRQTHYISIMMLSWCLQNAYPMEPICKCDGLDVRSHGFVKTLEATFLSVIDSFVPQNKDSKTLAFQCNSPVWTSSVFLRWHCLK